MPSSGWYAGPICHHPPPIGVGGRSVRQARLAHPAVAVGGQKDVAAAWACGTLQSDLLHVCNQASVTNSYPSAPRHAPRSCWLQVKDLPPVLPSAPSRIGFRQLGQHVACIHEPFLLCLSPAGARSALPVSGGWSDTGSPGTAAAPTAPDGPATIHLARQRAQYP